MVAPRLHRLATEGGFLTVGEIAVFIEYTHEDRTNGFRVSRRGIDEPHFLGFTVYVGVHVMAFTRRIFHYLDAEHAV